MNSKKIYRPSPSVALVALLVVQLAILGHYFGIYGHPQTTYAEIRIVDSEFYPKTIRAYLNDKVTVRIINHDNYAHGFAITDFNVVQAIGPAQTVTVEFMPDQEGTFRFSCNIMCKREKHPFMRGELIVSAPL